MLFDNFLFFLYFVIRNIPWLIRDVLVEENYLHKPTKDDVAKVAPFEPHFIIIVMVVDNFCCCYYELFDTILEHQLSGEGQICPNIVYK